MIISSIDNITFTDMITSICIIIIIIVIITATATIAIPTLSLNGLDGLGHLYVLICTHKAEMLSVRC